MTSKLSGVVTLVILCSTLGRASVQQQPLQPDSQNPLVYQPQVGFDCYAGCIGCEPPVTVVPGTTWVRETVTGRAPWSRPTAFPGVSLISPTTDDFRLATQTLLWREIVPTTLPVPCPTPGSTNNWRVQYERKEFCGVTVDIPHITKGNPPATVTVPVPGPTITVPGPGPTITLTVPGPTITVPGIGSTITVPVPGPTITVPGGGSTITVPIPGPTITVPGTGTTITVPVPGPTITVPGIGSTVTVPVPGPTITVPGIDSTITIPVPGPTITVPGIGSTITVPVPGPTITIPAPGPTTTIPVPGPTTTIEVTKTVTIPVPGPTITITPECPTCVNDCTACGPAPIPLSPSGKQILTPWTIQNALPTGELTLQSSKFTALRIAQFGKFNVAQYQVVIDGREGDAEESSAPDSQNRKECTDVKEAEKCVENGASYHEIVLPPGKHTVVVRDIMAGVSSDLHSHGVFMYTVELPLGQDD